MEKILVTTDLSANARAGLRFAIQYARQHKVELVVLHIHYVLRASIWSDKTYEMYVKETQQNLQKDLENWIKSVYRSVKADIGLHHAVLVNQYDIENTIIKYASANNCRYIFMSTRGAGLVRKVFGTITSGVLTRSSVPVVVVPKHYRTNPIRKLMYASDGSRQSEELEQVIGFARGLKAKVELVHFSYGFEKQADAKIKEKELQTQFNYPVSILNDKREIEKTLVKDIEEAVKRTKPSVVVMFTRQRQSFFERLFLSSKSADYSFKAKVPLLVFNKRSVL